MDALLLLLLIPILILVIGVKNRMAAVERELQVNRLQMQELMKALARRVGGEPPPSESRAAQARPEPMAPAPPVVAPPEPVRPPIVEPPPRAPEPSSAHPLEVVEPPVARPVMPAVPPPPPPPRKPSFLERNPDLEKFIGENLINKIGIAILVIGLGLLLKYEIDAGHIGESARTLIGIGSGGLLLFFAHRLRESFRAFSSVLVGGGLSVLYFSIAIAFQQYHLFGQAAAFAIMVGITGLGVLFTLLYDRRELAVIALLGGFASPFMVATGEGNYKVLFTYVLILDAGMLVLANYKKWSILNILSFALTWLLFAGWSISSYTELDPRPVWPAFAFGTAFYAVFFAMVLLYDLRHRTAFTPLDYALFLLNTAVFFGTGMHFLTDLDVRVGGLLCVLLAAVNVVFALRFFRDERVPRNLVFLLIGIVLTFISLAAPVQLEGDHITLFWAAEGVLLVWFAHRSGIRLVERASLAVNALMVISLIMDMGLYSAPQHVAMMPLLNRVFITGAAVVLSLALQFRLWAKWDTQYGIIAGLRPTFLRGVLATAAAVLGYFTGLLELNHQLGRILPEGSVAMAAMAWSLLYLIAADLLTTKAARAVRWAFGGLFALAFLLYTTWHYGMGMRRLREHVAGGSWQGHLVTHYLALGLMVVMILRVMRWSRDLLTLRSSEWNRYAWVLCTLLVIIASQELDHVLLAVQPPSSDGAVTDHAMRLARTAGYPILWGVGSFLFMAYGMRARIRTVRIIALSLFGLTLVKLFAVDIWNASRGAQVAAFICLGVLLLVMSFLYQKLKLLLQDDTDASTR